VDGADETTVTTAKGGLSTFAWGFFDGRHRYMYLDLVSQLCWMIIRLLPWVLETSHSLKWDHPRNSTHDCGIQVIFVQWPLHVGISHYMSKAENGPGIKGVVMNNSWEYIGVD